MPNWRLAKSLITLRTQLNAKYPQRSKASDGSIGDQAHWARVSDHNPDSKGRVTALDITHDPAHGLNGLALATSLIEDPRAKYVIFAARIWKARTGQWEDYHGINAHRKHVHISVKQENADDESEWDLGE